MGSVKVKIGNKNHRDLSALDNILEEFKKKQYNPSLSPILSDVTEYRPFSVLITTDIPFFIYTLLMDIFYTYIKNFAHPTKNLHKLNKINIIWQPFMFTLDLDSEISEFKGMENNTDDIILNAAKTAITEKIHFNMFDIISKGASLLKPGDIDNHIKNNFNKKHEPMIKDFHTDPNKSYPDYFLNYFHSFSYLNEKKTSENIYNIVINSRTSLQPLLRNLDTWNASAVSFSLRAHEKWFEYAASKNETIEELSVRSFCLTTFLMSDIFINSPDISPPYNAPGAIKKAYMDFSPRIKVSTFQETLKQRLDYYERVNSITPLQKDFEKLLEKPGIIQNNADLLANFFLAGENKKIDRSTNNQLNNFSSVEEIKVTQNSKVISGFDLLKDEFSRRKKFCSIKKIPIHYSTILVGPTGVGKTEIAKWIAFNENRQLYSFKIGSIMSMWQGETESQMDKLLHTLNSIENAVILLDEIEKEINADHDSNGTNVRLIRRIMDFIQNNETQIIIATSNDISKLKPELLRRFDSSYHVDYPNLEQLIDIFKAINLKELNSSLFRDEKYLRKICTDMCNKSKYCPDDINTLLKKAYEYEVIEETKITSKIFEEFVELHIPIYSKEKAKIDKMELLYKDYPNVNTKRIANSEVKKKVVNNGI